MRCKKCGAVLVNKMISINGVVLCENCAREVTREQQSFFGSAFQTLDELSSAFMSSGLDFANTRITCSKCGSTLRDIETSGKVGCIECYNTFNETILKSILKRQGNSEYRGRMPGEEIFIESGEQEDVKDTPEEKPAKKSTAASSARRTQVKKTEDAEVKKSEKKTEKKASAKAESSKEDRIAKLNKADLGMLDDKALEDGMKLAVECEDYILAARLRDELKSRKGDQ